MSFEDQVGFTGVSAIQAMVAPVVLITTCGLLTTGLLQLYSAIHDRMRAMTRELLDIRTGPQGELLDAASVAAVGQERLREIGEQLPLMLRRHNLLRASIILIYVAIAVLVLSVVAIAVAVAADSGMFDSLALALVLAGTIVMLWGVLVAGRSLAWPASTITLAVERTRSLGLQRCRAPSTGPIARNIRPDGQHAAPGVRDQSSSRKAPRPPPSWSRAPRAANIG